jgi:hypothetical protein
MEEGKSVAFSSKKRTLLESTNELTYTDIKREEIRWERQYQAEPILVSKHIRSISWP